MAQDTQTQAAITAALLAYYTSVQVDALLGDYRTASAQDTQTQAAIAGALLAYRTSPDQDVFTTNQITSYRSAADQDTATASSIAAALLSHYTIAQDKLGVTQIAVRFPDDGGADKVVAAIAEQSLGPRTSRCQTGRFAPVILATHTAGAVSVDVYTLTLAVNPWNIVCRGECSFRLWWKEFLLLDRSRSHRSRGAGLAFPSLLRTFWPQRSGDEAVTKR